MSANGIICQLDGPFNGRRHDAGKCLLCAQIFVDAFHAHFFFARGYNNNRPYASVRS